MVTESRGSTYEDARNQRLLENKKVFENLGLLKLSKSLSVVTKSEKPQGQHVRRKPTDKYLIEPRRSSRARSSVPSYRDDVDVEVPSLRRRSKLSSSWSSYLARPIEEVKSASYEERARAHKCAEKLQSNLQSEYPSFVKSMVRSHVYSCFWLGLPTRFCEDHLPGSTVDMVLEDEEGSEYDAIFISKRTGLSGGWRAFALDHKLDDGDALVFELIEPTRFKVYIVRAFDFPDENNGVAVPIKVGSPCEKVEAGNDAEKIKKDTKKRNKSVSHQLRNSTQPDSGKSSQTSAIRRSLRNKNNSPDQNSDVAVPEAGSDAEETPKDIKNRNNSGNHRSKNSIESVNEKSPQASATRRSLRNKSNCPDQNSDVAVLEACSDTEETPPKNARKRKSRNSTDSDSDRSQHVPATRRSLRNKKK